VLPATDPANPYGSALPWPKTEQARLMRAAGAHVVLVDGALVAFLTRSERELFTFLPSDEPARSRQARALLQALADWMTRSGRPFVAADGVDGRPAAVSPLAALMADAGLVAYGPGLRLRAARSGSVSDDPGA
jgi:ATP-dependent Lhr-like helicase